MIIKMTEADYNKMLAQTMNAATQSRQAIETLQAENELLKAIINEQHSQMKKLQESLSYLGIELEKRKSTN